MNIQDPTATPSAFLEQLLEKSDGRLEQITGEVFRIEGVLESVAAPSQAATPEAPLRVQQPDQAVQHFGSQPVVQAVPVATAPEAPQRAPPLAQAVGHLG